MTDKSDLTAVIQSLEVEIVAPNPNYTAELQAWRENVRVLRVRGAMPSDEQALTVHVPIPPETTLEKITPAGRIVIESDEGGGLKGKLLEND